jgi:hypothetical protein
MNADGEQKPFKDVVARVLPETISPQNQKV